MNASRSIRLMSIKVSPHGEDAPERDTEEIKATLSQIIDLSHTAASDLAAGPSRFSLVKVNGISIHNLRFLFVDHSTGGSLQ